MAFDASSRWAAGGADAPSGAGRAAAGAGGGAGAAGDDAGDDAGIITVGMSMSSSMLIIMAPLMIGAGYAGAVVADAAC